MPHSSATAFGITRCRCHVAPFRRPSEQCKQRLADDSHASIISGAQRAESVQQSQHGADAR